MIDTNGKIRLSNLHTIEEKELGAKTRLNVTVLPRTSNWLKGGGNASHTIDELVEAAIDGNPKPADHPLQKIEELTRENEELKAALSQLQKEPEQRQDYQVIREQVLRSLKSGRQAPGYRSAVKALDRFVAEIR